MKLSQYQTACRKCPVKATEIAKTLKDKYGAYKVVADWDQSGWNGEFKVEDTVGSTLSADWSPVVDEKKSKISIRYSRSMKQLEQLYESHLSELEKKANSKKPDKSNEL